MFVLWISIISRNTIMVLISIFMIVWTTQNDSSGHVRHVWDIFGTIRPLKIIFWCYIFENFHLKMSKNTFIGPFWLYKGTYYLFEVRNEEFRCLRSEYMTIIISYLFKFSTQMTLKVASFHRSLELKLLEIWKN